MHIFPCGIGNVDRGHCDPRFVTEEAIKAYRAERETPKVWTFRFETWLPFLGIRGTIRTVPENYYVADVRDDGTLSFAGLEAMTRNINANAVRAWWDSQSKEFIGPATP